MQNILLIGGAGFIGSNLIKTLLNKGYQNIFVYEPTLANISRILQFQEKLTIIRGVLADYDLLYSLIIDHKIQTIIHLVSTLIPGSTYEEYKLEFERVVFPSIRLMGLCSEKGIKFIYFSSGGTIYGNSINGNFKETDHPTPISYYGLSKQIIENNILFEHRVRNLCYLIIRPSNPFGPGQSLNGQQGLIAVSIGRILGDQPITIWGEGKLIRDYIYIADLSEACFQLIQNRVENDTINIGSGVGYSVNDIISKLRNISNYRFKVEYVDRRSVDVDKMVLDISKLKKYTNITYTPIEEGMQIFFNNAKLILKK
jgi:UDP-glucose 4-epimerase